MSLSAKRLAASISALLLLLLLTLPLVAVLLRDPLVNSRPVRAEISALLRELTGRQVTLAGDIDINDFPWITVTVGPGELENPAGFRGPPLAQWAEIRLRLHYSSIYADSPLLAPVVVSGLKINLQRDAAGRDNWSELGPLIDTGPPTAPLVIPGIELRGLQLRYVDESVASQPLAEFADAHLTVKDIRRGVGAAEGSRWRIGSLELESRGTARTGDSTLSETLRMRLDDIDASFPEEITPAVMIGRAAMEFGALGVDLAQLNWAPGTLATRLELRPAALDALLRTAGVEPPFASTPSLLQLRELSTLLQLEDDTVHIREFDARFDRTRIRGELTLGEPVTVSLDIDSLDIDRYAAALGGDRGADPGDPLTFPGRLLQGLPLSGRIRIGELRSSGALLAGVTLRLESAPRAGGRTADKPAGTPTSGRPAR